MDLRSIMTPSEPIIETEPMLLLVNFEKFISTGKRVVRLACGHLHLTKNKKSSVCPRCTEMLRRSVKDGSEDHESFRRGSVIDRMDWCVDPCIILNQPRIT